MPSPPSVAILRSAAARWRDFVWRHSRKEPAHGVPIGVLLPGEEDAAIRARVAKALDRIALHDARWMSRLRRLVSGIYVEGNVGPRGMWLTENHRIQLRASFVLSHRTSAEEIAGVIVHETVHAWLHSRGLAYDEPVRHLHERLCMRAQAAFLRRTPGMESLAAEADERRLALDPADYTDAAFRARSRRYLEEMGIPRRLVVPLSLSVRAVSNIVDALARFGAGWERVPTTGRLSGPFPLWMRHGSVDTVFPPQVQAENELGANPDDPDR